MPANLVRGRRRPGPRGVPRTPTRPSGSRTRLRRSCAAAPGTWRRCRGGAATAGRCRATGPAQSGTPGSSAAASSSRTSRRCVEHRSHHAAGLGRAPASRSRRATTPPGPDQVERRGDQPPLQQHQAEQVVGAPPPARLGTAAQRAQAGARRVDQHPVEPARAVTAARCRRRPRRRARRRRRASARRDQAGRGAPGARRRPARRRARRPARRAARPCRRGRRRGRARPRPSPRRGAAASDERDQLRALVLDAGAALGDRRDLARVAARQHHAVGRVRRRLAGQLGAGRTARAGRPASPGAARCRPRAASNSSAGPTAAAQLVDDPARVAVGDRGVLVGGLASGPARPARSTRRGPAADTLRSTALAKPPAPELHLGADQVDGRADRGVRRHPHREQLVGAEPQRVEHLGLDLAAAAGRCRRPGSRRTCRAGGSSRRPAR